MLKPVFRLARGADRRGAGRILPLPPYITEEGLVLVDRRSNRERRHGRRQYRKSARAGTGRVR